MGGSKKLTSPSSDPVNPQPQASSPNSRGDSDDPVYGQPSSPAQPTGPSHRTPASGDAIGYEDPVYPQPKTVNTEASPSADIPQSQPHSATSRLQQLTSQIAPTPTESSTTATTTTDSSNTSKPRRKPKSNPASDLPADYSDILSHLSTIDKITSHSTPTSRGYARQVSSGKLWARDRITQFLDKDTFHEFGALSGQASWSRSPANPQSESLSSFVPTNNPQGFGMITDPATGMRRRVYLTADDFTIRAGHADGGNSLKTLHGEKLALKLRVPVVKMCDGSSGGGSVSTIMKAGWSYIPNNTYLSVATEQLNAGIPNLGMVLGPAIGLGAARVVCTHFSVMAGDVGSLFNAGPKVVEGATFEEDLSFQDLGGPAVHCTNGTIDNLAKDEKGCFDQVRTVLGYLPDYGGMAPPVVKCDDDVNREDLALRSIIPRKKGRAYNPFAIILSIVDRGSWFEIGGLWGRTAIVGLARLGGRPVGVMSLNCEVNSGALDAGGSQKMTKMLKFCDVFNLPILQFVDVPGYAIGTNAERTATMKHGIALATAYYTTTTPIFSVITRRCYGVAGGVMLDSRDPIRRIAWPSANWGSLPLDGGIEVGHRHELNEIRQKDGEEGWKRRYRELEDEYIRLMNPVRTANAFGVEEIVDPKGTRGRCCAWAEEYYGVVMQERLSDRATRKIVPVFS